MAWFTKSADDATRSKCATIFAVCPKCNAYVSKVEWKKNLCVCPICNYHQRMTASDRIKLITDEGSFTEINADIVTTDPLKFVDVTGPYESKVTAAIAKTALKESIITGTATIDAIPVMLGVMDFRFLGGSLGTATGERICLAAEEAIRGKLPLILFSASGGARMHEGILSLMQMAKTCAAVQRLKDAGLPFISVLTDPTTGGVSASYAMIGDLHIAEPKALIGFAGRRVIENTIKQKLPDEFQTAEYLLEHGFLDKIVDRKNLKALLAKVLRYAQGN